MDLAIPTRHDFDIIKKNKNTKELIRYYESFTIEKEGDYLKASTISFLYIILIFSILFFGFNNFKIGCI